MWGATTQACRFECELWGRQKVGWPTVAALHAARVHLEDYMTIAQSFDGGLRKRPASSIAEGMLELECLFRVLFSSVVFHWRAMVYPSAVPLLGKQSTSLTVIYNLKSTLFCQFKYKPQHFKNLCSIRFFWTLHAPTKLSSRMEILSGIVEIITGIRIAATFPQEVCFAVWFPCSRNV